MIALSALVITSDPTIDELVHAMLESEGCSAYGPRDDEGIVGAIERLRPSVALILPISHRDLTGLLRAELGDPPAWRNDSTIAER